jgi:hypothetical protein
MAWQPPNFGAKANAANAFSLDSTSLSSGSGQLLALLFRRPTDMQQCSLAAACMA